MKHLKLLFVLFALVLATGLARGQANSVYAWRNFVGQSGGAGNVDGTGSAARFCQPSGLAVDNAGNLYAADSANNTIRKVTSDGVVTTLAGVAGQSGSDDGRGSAARFYQTSAVAVDSAGNLYVADSNNDTIRKVTSAGVVTTLAGLAGQPGSADGTGSAARFYQPSALAVDSAGNLYVADSNNNTIRKVTSAGVVTTLAGLAGQSGSADGTGSAAQFYYPSAVAVDSAGNVYVADCLNNTIRKVTSAGVVTTLAGLAGQSGSADGTGSAARFRYPRGLAVDSACNLYVGDTDNCTIRKVTSAGVVTTLAGSAVDYGSDDGTGSAARFYFPSGVALDGAGNVYVADLYNHTIRKVTSAGLVTTLAGLAEQIGSTDGTGSAARFNVPLGVAVDSAGSVYVAEVNNNTIRKVTSAGVVTTLAGLAGESGSADGTGSAARFDYPSGVAVDSAGNAYVADNWNCTIRKVTSAGVVTTLAGLAGQAGSADGTGNAARFYAPYGVAVDNAGNVYVADCLNNTIRKVTSAGVVTTLAGSAGQSGSADGTGSAARFNGPEGVAVDGAGNVFVADTYNHTVRKLTSAGVVTTIGGTAGVVGGIDGVGSAAEFNSPLGIAVDSAGNAYVADVGNNRISKGTPGPTMTAWLSGGSVMVSWPSLFTGFVPQTNTSVGDAGGWTDSGYSISDDGTNKSITVSSPTGNLFFRLRSN